MKLLDRLSVELQAAEALVLSIVNGTNLSHVNWRSRGERMRRGYPWGSPAWRAVDRAPDRRIDQSAEVPSRLGDSFVQQLQSQDFNQDTGSSRRLRLLHNSLHRFFDGLFSKAKCAADFFVGVTFG